MVVTTDTADAAGDEVSVARVFALHEETIASEDVRGTIGFRYLPVLEVNLGINAQAANDACHRIPRHLYKLWWLSWGLFSSDLRRHETVSLLILIGRLIAWSSFPRWLIARRQLSTRVPPFRFLVECVVRQRA